MTKRIACPICGTQIEWVATNAWRPFCSERCKLIDLGDWAAERHVIAGQHSAADVPSPGDEGKPLAD
jgi:endogenous inhibitor of DNA gyrase (YacG/DUF329 family)